jgi:CheY-like chemotaxis protein
MGLAVSYGIISLHGGTIDVETEPGHGTVFAIRLPLAKTTRDVPVVAPSTPVSPRRVLIIDDEPVVREVLVDLLEEQGHKAAAATSGAEGIAMLERSAVDVVFTDLAMPDMDGWAVARFVRQRWPGVKVVLVTGYGTSVTQPKDEPNLVDAVLGKPFEYEDIAAVLRRLGGDQ